MPVIKAISAARRAAFRPLKLLPRAISGLKAALQKQNPANTKKPVSVMRMARKKTPP
jgi:hypothetical protein